MSLWQQDMTSMLMKRKVCVCVTIYRIQVFFIYLFFYPRDNFLVDLNTNNILCVCVCVRVCVHIDLITIGTLVQCACRYL